MKKTRAKPLLSSAAWKRLRRWFHGHGRHQLPWRTRRTPWRILLAETMLHRTRAEAVAELFRALALSFPEPKTVLKNPRKWLRKTRPAGLMWRARFFIKTCRILEKTYQGQIPKNWKTLATLPGVGHYVANAVNCFGYHEKVVLVDTNTIRLATRISGKNLNKTNHRSLNIHALVARLGRGCGGLGAEDNFALLDLAALICKPEKPACSLCPLRKECSFGRSRIDEKGDQDDKQFTSKMRARGVATVAATFRGMRTQ